MKRLSVLGVVLLVASLALAAGPTIQVVGWAFKGGLSIGSGSTWDTASNRVTQRYGKSATIDFASTTVGVSTAQADGGTSTITVSGAAVGDICTVSAPAAASALNAKFSCVVTAANTVKVLFEPLDEFAGAVALTSGTPSTATAEVRLGSLCTCAPRGTTAAIAAAGCATSLADNLDGGVGTLTLTGPNTVTTTVVYDCAAPVDPAEGSYTIELVRNGS